jgi:hypothetical protein
MTTTIFEPTVAGAVSRKYQNETWDALRTSAGTHTGTNSLWLACTSHVSGGDSGKYRTIDRSIQTFDTSTLGNVRVTAARLKIFTTGGIYTMTDVGGVGVFSASPASNIVLVAADYSTLGIILISNLLYYSNVWSPGGSGWQTFTLTTTGLTNINTTGYTRLGLREYEHDVLGVAPIWADANTASTAFDGVGGNLHLEVDHEPVTTVTDADSRVSSIRHSYRSGPSPVYQATLGLGKLDSLPDYDNSLDKLKEEMKIEAIQFAIHDIQFQPPDLLINRPITDLGNLPPNIRKIWTDAQGKRSPDVFRKLWEDLQKGLNK